MFYGAGAGKLPTASAVVADVIDCARHLHLNRFAGWQDSKENLITPRRGVCLLLLCPLCRGGRRRGHRRPGPVSDGGVPAGARGAGRAWSPNPLSGADMAEKLAALGGKALSCIRIL